MKSELGKKDLEKEAADDEVGAAEDDDDVILEYDREDANEGATISVTLVLFGIIVIAFCKPRFVRYPTKCLSERREFCRFNGNTEVDVIRLVEAVVGCGRFVDVVDVIAG